MYVYACMCMKLSGTTIHLWIEGKSEQKRATATQGGTPRPTLPFLYFVGCPLPFSAWLGRVFLVQDGIFLRGALEA